MKVRKIYTVLSIALISVILCSCPKNNTVNNPDPVPVPTISEMKQELLDLINNHRSSKSLTTLSNVADLDSIAVKHSFKMAIQKNTDATGLDDLLVSYKQQFPNAIVQSIVSSTSNAEPSSVYNMIRDFQITMLEGDFNNIGIGIYKNGSYFYTVLFSKN